MVAMEMPHVKTPMEALNVYVMMGMREMDSFVLVCYTLARERGRGRERGREGDRAGGTLRQRDLLIHPILPDIDECLEGIHTCGSSAVCTNINGGFECACLLGYEGDGFTCESKYMYINTVYSRRKKKLTTY